MYGKKRNEMIFSDAYAAIGGYDNLEDEMSEDDLTHYMKKCSELSAERDVLEKCLDMAVKALGYYIVIDDFTMSIHAREALAEIEQIRKKDKILYKNLENTV
jgi:hypothetical protein